MKYLIIIFVVFLMFNYLKAQDENKFKNKQEVIQITLNSLYENNIDLLDSILVTGEILQKNVKALENEPVEMLENNIKNNPELKNAFKKIVNEIAKKELDISKFEIQETYMLPQQRISPDLNPPHHLIVDFKYEKRKGNFKILVIDDSEKLYFVQFFNSEDFFQFENN
jgi:hypothetical protein